MSARGRHRRQRARRISRVSLMLTAGGAGVALPLLVAGAANAAPQAAADATYTVVAGDTLNRIAQAQDVDGGWQALYDANRDVIGADPDVIRPGQELVLNADTDADAGAGADAPAEDTAATAESAGGYTAPVAGVSGSGYGAAGAMWSSGYHTGVDFPVGTGTSVVSIAAGEVVSAGDGGAYGNEVVVLHADGHYSQYAHLSSISVGVGQQVGSGEQLGLSGATGNVTGPHLHFEVRTGPDYGSDIDPLAYLRANGVAI